MIHRLAVLLLAIACSVPGIARAQDEDGDLYPTGIDCDDTDPTINPAADEICDDGIDQNCAPDRCAVNPYTGIEDCFGWDLVSDVDGDGFGSAECGADPEDCDDDDPLVFPGASEVCNGEDDDCDGLLPPDEADGDQDGSTACGDDCDDANAQVGPDQSELGACADGLDNDCDGLVDDAEPDCQMPPQPRVEGRIEVDYLGPGTVATIDASGTTDPNPTDTLTFDWGLSTEREGVSLAADGALGVVTFAAPDDDPGPWAIRVTLWIDDGVWLVGPLVTVVAFYRPEEAPVDAGCAHGSGAASPSLLVLALLGMAAITRRR